MISTFDFGNTSSPSIPLALSKIFKEKFISKNFLLWVGAVTMVNSNSQTLKTLLRDIICEINF